MGEIIKFPPRREKNDQNDLGLLNWSHFGKMLYFLTELAKENPETMNDEQIQAEMRGLEDIATSWLVERINQSDEHSWRALPIHYNAIITVLRRRNLRRS